MVFFWLNVAAIKVVKMNKNAIESRRGLCSMLCTWYEWKVRWDQCCSSIGLPLAWFIVVVVALRCTWFCTSAESRLHFFQLLGSLRDHATLNFSKSTSTPQAAHSAVPNILIWRPQCFRFLPHSTAAVRTLCSICCLKKFNCFRTKFHFRFSSGKSCLSRAKALFVKVPPRVIASARSVMSFLCGVLCLCALCAAFSELYG